MGLFRKKDKFKEENSAVMQARYTDAHRIELQRMEVKKEIENIVAAYAKESGNQKLRQRKHRLGHAPNDWKQNRF